MSTLTASHTQAEDFELGSDQAQLIRRAQAVVARLECNLAWASEWRDLILALGTGRDLALHAAKTNTPHGRKYQAVIGPWLRCYGFDRINEGDRSRLLKCYDNLAAINTWRATLLPDQQTNCNHPRTVLARWKRSLLPVGAPAEKMAPPAAAPQTPGLNDAWKAASAAERREWLDRLGREDLCGAMSPELKADLAGHAVGQQARSADASSSLAVTLTQVLQVGLATDDPNRAATAFDKISAKLTANSLTYHDVHIALVGGEKLPQARQKGRA